MATSGSKPTEIVGLNEEWAHFDNLVFALPLIEGVGTPEDLTGKDVTMSGNWTWETTEDGDACLTRGADNTILSIADAAFSSAVGTLCFIVYTPSFNGATTHKLFQSNDSRMFLSAGQSHQIRTKASNTAFNDATALVMSGLGYKVLVFVYDSQTDAAGAGKCLWKNGVKTIAANDVADDAAGHTAPLHIFANTTGGQGYLASQLVGAFGLDVALSDAQIEALSADEWGWLNADVAPATNVDGPLVSDLNDDGLLIWRRRRYRHFNSRRRG